jgi:hypothetical protein
LASIEESLNKIEAEEIVIPELELVHNGCCSGEIIKCSYCESIMYDFYQNIFFVSPELCEDCIKDLDLTAKHKEIVDSFKFPPEEHIF